MFFSLTAWGPASLGLPPPRDRRFGSALLLGPPSIRNRLSGKGGGREGGTERGRDGGRPAGRQQPGLALPCFVPASPSRLSPPRGPARPAPHPPGCPHLLGPASWLGAAHAQGARPRPRRSHRSPRPAASAEASLARCQAAWEPGPGGWGAGRGAPVPAEGEAQMPRQPEGPLRRLPSPEAHKGTDNTGGLVTTVMCGAGTATKGLIYLFSSHTQIRSCLCEHHFTRTGEGRCHGRPTPPARPASGQPRPPAGHFHI